MAEQCSEKSEFKLGGYECELLQKPPKAFQAECPVCLQILCEPYQVNCCGYSFCKTCIEPIQTGQKSCPTCNKGEFTTFHDKRLQRTLYQFEVYCTHKQQGCEWTGELGQLDKHLNLNPDRAKYLEGCQLSEIKCTYCSDMFQRRNIITHEVDLCPKRPFSCKYCQQYQSNYYDVTHDHWPVCGFQPVPCPNECGTFPQRQNLQTHITKECPLTVIDCDFHHVVCDVKLPRKDMPTHLNENLVTHMSLQAASHSKLLAAYSELNTSNIALQQNLTRIDTENQQMKRDLITTQERNKELEQTVENLEERITKQEESSKQQLESLQEQVTNLQRSLKTVEEDTNLHKQKLTDVEKEQKDITEQLNLKAQELKICTEDHTREISALKDNVSVHTQQLEQQLMPYVAMPTTGYVVFRMRKYDQLKQDDGVWYSPPFYTHLWGYKMCLRVDANGTGNGKGTYITVSFHMMKGGFDNHLKWPFRGDITILLLNQEEAEGHYSKTVNFDDDVPNDIAGRVKDKDKHSRGRGYRKFIRQNDLTPKYLKNDTLCFRIDRVVLH